MTRPLSPGWEMQVAFARFHRLGMPAESSNWAWRFCSLSASVGNYDYGAVRRGDVSCDERHPQLVEQVGPSAASRRA